MRKYKVGGVGVATPWYRSNLLYFFLAWNAAGLCAFTWFKSRKVKNDEKWSKLSSSQKYLYLMSKPDDEVTVISMKGIQSVDKQTMSIEDYTQPKTPSESK